MTDTSSDHEIERWKQQYYDQLDVLDRKGKDWRDLEASLKNAVLRLSIAAEGQHATVDRHLKDVRSMVKHHIDTKRLDRILEDISVVLLKLGEHNNVDKKVVNILLGLLENIELPVALGGQKKRLIKKLAKSSDKNSTRLMFEIQDLLSTAVAQAPVKTGKGWFTSLLGTSDTNDASVSTNSVDTVIELGDSASSVDIPVLSPAQISHSNSDLVLPVDLSALRNEESEPSVREILIRLLEQLLVPSDLQNDVDGLKERIEAQSSKSSWKLLLKDVAYLINKLRSRMQEEKLEFESFLHQITQRLREIDGFLEIENISINEASKFGESFDATMSTQVQNIHQDMNTADNLDDLKVKVEKRLTIVSEHIKQYRVKEQERYSDAQKNVADMQSKLVLLEQESGDLQRLILEKNKEAMIDVLTGIPNRLSYEKKAAEEIARCNRFATPLSMVIWDVDLFKLVNDTYGHKVGDRVLKIIARLLADRMRETDFIARYGGEEFVMFLPGADESSALEMANELREKIAGSKFSHNDEAVDITVSCGISSFSKGDTHESLFERADKALYSAKHNGRNLCVIAAARVTDHG